jgi:hypothetical protein
MKVKHLLVALLVPFACACSNDSLNEVVDQSNQPQVVSRSAENMLSFESEASFRQTVNLLSSMDENEQKSWISSHLGIITSLKDIYDMAMEDAASLDESREAYLAYKSKYENILYFSSYKDDCGAYLPVNNRVVALLTNINGDVKIGNEVRNLKDISNYTQLQEAGLAMYDAEEDRNYVESRSASDAPIVSVSKAGEPIGNNKIYEYSSGWYQENKRKIKLNCGRQVSTIDSNRRVITPKLHIEISFRKKTWLGWSNYSSKTTTTGTFTGGYVGTINFHKSADSSHDWYQDFTAANIGNIGPKNEKILYYSAPITADLSVDFRGMGTTLKYKFTLKEIRFAGL